jgi:hypothetical protein
MEKLSLEIRGEKAVAVNRILLTTFLGFFVGFFFLFAPVLGLL